MLSIPRRITTGLVLSACVLASSAATFGAGVIPGHAHAQSAAAAVGSTSLVQASAPKPRPLSAGDFFGAQNSQVADSGAFAGTYSEQIAVVVALEIDKSAISFDARNFPSSYNAVTFGIGAIEAGSLTADSHLLVQGDGHTIADIQPTSASGAQHVTVRLGGHHIITFVRKGDATGEWYLFSPTLVQAGPTPPPAPRIVLASGTVQGGGQQTVDVATSASRQVTILIIYANGTHTVAGPQRSGPTGHDIYTFTVPQGTSGSAQVVAVVTGLGIAQATFTVS